MRYFNLWKDKRGTEVLEFALVMAFVLPLFIFGIIYGGRLLWTQTSLDYVAQYKARCLGIDCPQPDVGLPGLNGATFTTSPCDDGKGIKVTGSIPFYSLVPFFPNHILSTSACYPTSQIPHS